MSATPETLAQSPSSRPLLARIALPLLVRAFSGLEGGTLEARLPDGSVRRFGEGPAVRLDIRDERLFARIASHGAVGFGESYQAGEWASDDLVPFLELLFLNATRGRERHPRLTKFVQARPRANRRQGILAARRNIAAHYDLGNDLFRLMLDKTMTYSCAIFEEADEALEDAQRRKLRRVCEKLELQPGDRVLEIGCGWGSFALVAAGEFGAHVTGLTLSAEQARLARARVGGWLMKAIHAMRPNTRRGSRRNIAAHYDLGNELFALFLDENLMYSSAIFTSDEELLEVASLRKLERICEKLSLSPGDRVVEIGTGWGGFALHAASRYGCHVTTATISREQYELAKARVEAAGLADRVTVLLCDYRDLDGCYDKLVSIEMIEAIGAKQLDTYFAKCASLLKPDGMALVQAITIEDHRYKLAVNSVDFIKKFIFPGSFIPAISPMMASLGASSDLRLFHLEDIGPSYATTLRHWRQRFTANLDRVRALGYPDRFIRMWLFYLCYCEGGFIERSIGDVQMLLVKPACRRAAYLPDLQ